MKLKQIIILVVILLLLIAGVIAKHLRKPAELATQEYTSLDLSLDTSKVEKIQLGKGGAAGDPKAGLLVNIVKDSSGKFWRIPDFFNAIADHEKIDNFLKEIREAQGELRGNDKSLFADFKIGENEAFRVMLFDKDWKNMQAFFIGSKKTGYSLFVRKEGSNAIYLTTANLLGAMGISGDPAKDKPTIDYWASKRYADIEVGAVDKIETVRFQEGRQVIATSVIRQADPLDPSKKIWKYVRSETPFAIDAEKVKQFLSTLTGGQASKVLDPKAKDYGFLNPFWQMTLGREGEKEVILTVSRQNAETQNYFLHVSSKPVVFQLPGYSLQSMDRDESKFFVDNPFDINPDKVELLKIHKGEKEWSFNPKQKKWESLTTYLNDLKTFTVTRLLFNGPEQKKATPLQWIEIQKEGASSTILEVGDIVSEKNKEYAANLRNNTQPFALSEATFKLLFENLDRLNPPKADEAPKTAANSPPALKI